MLFNGKKLTELRLLKGWSRLELAQVLDVTEQAIWQFETKGVRPDQSSTLMKILRVFEVKLSYFSEEDTPDIVEVGRIAFRNGDSNSKRIVQIQKAYINKIHSIFKYTESYLVPPQWTFPDLHKRVIQYIDEGKDLEEIAQFVKNYLEVSVDNHDLMYKLERSGINILTKVIDLDKNADAYSLWTRDETPYIILGKGKSAVRRNFDLAHELGHLLLHSHVNFEELSNMDLKEKEREADKFASYFLLPKDIFVEKFDKYVGVKVSNPDSYIALKSEFNVSIQALEYRAYKLGYLSLKQNSYFYRLINKKNYKKMEPLDDTILIKKPGKLVNIIDMILKSNQVTVNEFLENQGVTAKFFIEHLDLQENFFDTYMNQEEDYGQVIQLNSYQRKA
ncbi:XRE family transcriptional regulator [Lactococcus garvieae]|jgi:Zn-dependent peptidase ImmA (M78 family)/DNA-binding XRE family transcriptional regulator|nr:XRE family transcriptional regulator [Lactococcus garvieae]USI68257.1 XRE family transcriptional regulator [Lactococcus petauri]